MPPCVGPQWAAVGELWNCLGKPTLISHEVIASWSAYRGLMGILPFRFPIWIFYAVEPAWVNPVREFYWFPLRVPKGQNRYAL